jgi:hypothetical protein
MIHILVALTVVLFTVSFAFRNKWQFEETRLKMLISTSRFKTLDIYDQAILRGKAKQANKKWHAWQGAVQFAFFASVFPAIVMHPSIGNALVYVVMYMAFFWIVFDGLLNKIALEKPFFYVGKTATIDSFFQRLPRPEIAMAIIKFAIFIASLIVYIITA